MIFEFNWFNESGFKNVLSFVYTIVDIIRIIVPIALIVMTTLDISKKVINPEDKDGQKKIMTRAIAALIIFFIPLLINIVFKIMDIDVNSLKTGGSSNISNNTSNNNSSNHNNSKTNILTSISINNCPAISKKYKPGDVIELNTDIPSTYNGTITWLEDKANQKVFNITPSNNGRSVKLEVVNNPNTSIADITVKAGSAKKYCTILIDTKNNTNNEVAKLSSLNITNCPSPTESFNPGDKITLDTDIPSSFNGEIKWINDESHNEFIITPTNNNRSAILEVIDKPSSIFSMPSVSAGGLFKSCTIFVKQIKEIKITNCPSSDEVFNPGDKITLNVEIPSYFDGDITWHEDNISNNFIITPSKDSKSATLEVIDNPISTSSATTVYAGGAVDSCTIFVHK